MKLYTYPGAPNPRRVHMVLIEKDLDVPCETVDILKRENRSPAFVEKVDAMGRVPVLQLDDGTCIAESVAIARYLDAVHPAPPLFGTTPREIGVVEMWIRRMELDLMVPVGLVWIHGSPLTRAVMKQQIPEAAAQNRVRVGQAFDFLDAQLAGRDFIAGDALTMADIVAFTTIEFADALNDLRPAAGHERLNAWRQRVADRPSAKASAPRATG